jgi:hypothetical protein
MKLTMPGLKIEALGQRINKRTEAHSIDPGIRCNADDQSES